MLLHCSSAQPDTFTSLFYNMKRQSFPQALANNHHHKASCFDVNKHSNFLLFSDNMIIKRDILFFMKFQHTQGTQERRADGTLAPPASCPWTCELTNDAGYVVYSALGSFYIPMLVMLFFYWRIYRAAVRTTRAINQGFKTTKGN